MKNIIKVLVLSILFSSCSQEEFNIDNPNAPNASDVLSVPADFQNFSITNHTALFSGQIGFDAIYPNLLADQATTTNAFSGFWDYAEQPRLAINNQTTNDDLPFQAGGPWNTFNAVVVKANIIINQIENNGNEVIVDGQSFAEQELAAAYFDKGMAQGYLSMLYDRAYIVNFDTDPTTLEFSTYKEMLNEAIANMKKGVEVAQGASDFGYPIYTGGVPLDFTTFSQVANSYMARFTISNPRTDAEAATLDYNEILGYAENGITSDFNPPTKEDVLFNNFQDWTLFTLQLGTDAEAGYIPTDIKILHLFDTSYPTDYPEGTEILGPAESDDPRLESYYKYVTSFGFLNATRNRNLFTNYRQTRFFNGNDENQDALPSNLFLEAEIDYIKAESFYRMGDAASAVMALENSPRASVGNQNTSDNLLAVRNALLYEWSIELDLGAGIGTHWAFMRRHDMLQAGTPLHYPIPASELEISGLPSYTFGGAANAGQEGTASGANDWRNIDLTF